MKLSRDLWRAARSLINYAAVALATAAACDLYHHFADDPPDTWTPPVLIHEQGRCVPAARCSTRTGPSLEAKAPTSDGSDDEDEGDEEAEAC